MDLILTNAQVQTLDQLEIRLVLTILAIEVYMLDLHVPEEIMVRWSTNSPTCVELGV